MIFDSFKVQKYLEKIFLRYFSLVSEKILKKTNKKTPQTTSMPLDFFADNRIFKSKKNSISELSINKVYLHYLTITKCFNSHYYIHFLQVL